MEATRLRFTRCSRPALPWTARVRMCAAACMSAVAYGAGAVVWPKAAVRRLRVLGIPWRADTLACVMLTLGDFIRRARDYGDVTGPAIERLLTHCPRTAGPTAAANAGLETCDGVLVDGDMMAAGGERLPDFAAQPRLDVLRWLVGCLRSAAW